MSDERDHGADTTTQEPPRSYGRAGNSIISSSLLSPKSPVDRRRRSTVTFGAAASVAPSDSISKVKSRPSRSSGNFSAPKSRYSQRSRRRSAPWQDHDYRSVDLPGSSQGGTARSGDRAPLTATNLEEFNEKRPPRSAAGTQRQIERDVEVKQVDRKSTRRSRQDSGVISQDPPTRAGWTGAEDRRTSKASSSVDRDDGPAERTVVTSQRRTEDEQDGAEDEVETSSKSRYESYNRPAQSSKSKASSRRRSRTVNSHDQSSEQRQSGQSTARQTQRYNTNDTQQSRPSKIPSSNGNARTSKDVAIAAVAAEAAGDGSRTGGRSKAPSQYHEEPNEGQTRVIEVRVSSRRDGGRDRQTAAKSEHYSGQQEDEAESKSNFSQRRASRPSNRKSRAPSRPTQAEGPTAATSPSSSPSSPTIPQEAASPKVPSPIEPYWERRVHIIETIKPDGRMIQDREYSMRSFQPQQQVTA